MRLSLLLAVFFVLAVPLLAQDAPNPPMTPGMACPMPGMGGGMGQGMGMGGPMGHGMQCMCPMCGMMGMGGMLPGQMLLMHADMLKLTDDQIQKIRNIQPDFRRQQVRTGADIQLDQIDLQQELMKDGPDAAKAERLIRHINQLQADQQVAAMKASIAAKNVLTPEQRQMCSSMMKMKMMGPQMPGGMQPMGPPGGTPPMPPAPHH